MTIQCPKCKSENPEGTSFCGNCGTKLGPDAGPTLTAETPKQELTTGATFADRYQIIEELGKGGMGKVYRALDKELNEEIALKLIKPEIASDKKTIDRFRNELKVARDISHKNVCRMYDLNKENRYPNVRELLSDITTMEAKKTVSPKIPEWKNSITVLPFKKMSADPDEAQRYFRYLRKIFRI